MFYEDIENNAVELNVSSHGRAGKSAENGNREKRLSHDIYLQRLKIAILVCGGNPPR